MIARSHRFLSLSVLAAMATIGSTQQYLAHMDGLSEAPPNASPGHGMGIIDINVGAMTMDINVFFDMLLGNTTAAHIHAATAEPGTGTAGVATQTPSFTGFPLGVTSGVHVQSFDMSLASSWNPTYITNNGGTPGTAWAAFTTAIAQGRAYYNIHTNQFPGGEIRGFLTPVPEPGTMIALGLGAAALLRRRRK